METNKILCMKNKVFIGAVLSLLLSGGIIKAQQDVMELNLSLKEAQDFAIVNNKMVLSAKSDIEASKSAVWETISAALPQVSAAGSFNDNLKLMTTLLPGDFFGKPGEKVPVTFGSQYNSSGSITATMLLFNAPLYIGIETTKLAQKLSEDNLKRSELDTKESVSLAYYLILISEKSLEILNSNIANLKETLKSTRSMFSAGMAEATDVDQMISNVTMVENSKSSMERTIELNYNILRFQLGVPVSARIKLTGTLETLTAEVNVEALVAQDFDLKQNINYQLIERQEMMSSLNVRSQKAAVLPTLAGFYNYGTNGMGDNLSELQWFSNSMAGLQLSVPVFASGQKHASIRKAQFNLEKAKINKDMVSDQLLLQEKQFRYNLVNANLQYQSQKENVAVSRRIYTSTENKFRQGMASSLELTQANTIYLQSENNYISSLLNLFQTKLALDKLLNNL
jgi:outer membrane protein TolC